MFKNISILLLSTLSATVAFAQSNPGDLNDAVHLSGDFFYCSTNVNVSKDDLTSMTNFQAAIKPGTAGSIQSAILLINFEARHFQCQVDKNDNKKVGLFRIRSKDLPVLDAYMAGKFDPKTFDVAGFKPAVKLVDEVEEDAGGEYHSFTMEIPLAKLLNQEEKETLAKGEVAKELAIKNSLGGFNTITFVQQAAYRIDLLVDQSTTNGNSEISVQMKLRPLSQSQR